MSGRSVPGGVVHELPADLREALIANATAPDAWSDITPLARNEFICWVEDAKRAATRAQRPVAVRDHDSWRRAHAALLMRILERQVFKARRTDAPAWCGTTSPFHRVHPNARLGL